MSTEAFQPSPVLVAEQLTKLFGSRLRRAPGVLAVDRLDIELTPGRTLALVGESGSGKSTVARVLARLYAPSRGRIVVNGEELPRRLSRRRARRYRSHVQMIFQDPFASLNPVKTVEHHLIRPLKLHQQLDRTERRVRAVELLDSVGLTPPEEILPKYPHQLSGGQRQRVAFAAALAVDPTVLIADEPTSMLDVSIRVGLLNLIAELKERRQLAMLFITHDLASARYVADDILVLYNGRMVEQGPAELVLTQPRHPYTQLLLAAAPDVGESTTRLPMRTGGGPPPTPGCAFEPRCPYALARCATDEPQSTLAGSAHTVRCFAVEDGLPTG